MLAFLNFLFSGLLVTLILGQAVYVALYLRMRHRAANAPSGWTPPASIILCVRGRDPTLPNCLRGIARQDYPDFELVAVFDSAEDPGFRVVEEFRAKAKIPVRIVIIPKFTGKCGMKCEALIAAMESLDPRRAVVAMIDADSVAAANWLREMIAPLADQSVGAVTGDRWFEPNGSLASTVRAVWNAAAIVQMNLYRIAWGGSLAIRRETIERLRILDIWRTTFCEDTVLVDLFGKEDLQVVRPRQAVVFNRESIAWRNVHFWIARQLLTVRLHNRKWPLVFGHGLLVGLTLLSCIGFVVVDLALGQSQLAAITASSILLAILINFVLVGLIARENTKILLAQGQIFGPTSIAKHWFRWLVAIPLTQIIHFWATLRAFRMKYVIWRGIEYRVSHHGIEIIRYRPFVDRNAPAAEDVSLH